MSWLAAEVGGGGGNGPFGADEPVGEESEQTIGVRGHAAPAEFLKRRLIFLHLSFEANFKVHVFGASI